MHSSLSHFAWPLTCCCFFFFFFPLSALARLSAGRVFPSSLPHATPVCFVRRQFTFHRIVRRNARQEGRGQNNGFHGDGAKTTHPLTPLLWSCLKPRLQTRPGRLPVRGQRRLDCCRLIDGLPSLAQPSPVALFFHQ